jgi:hypothetical protein
MSDNLITQAIELVGLQPLAQNLKKPDGTPVTYQAVRKWETAGHLPRTEWTGETSYAEQIEHLTKRRVTKRALLQMKPGRVAEPT